MSSKVVLPQAARPAETVPSRARWRIFGLPIGKPQLIAGGLLALFLAQCFWFAARMPLSRTEISYILQGAAQFAGGPPFPSAALAFARAFGGGAFVSQRHGRARHLGPSRVSLRCVPVARPFLLYFLRSHAGVFSLVCIPPAIWEFRRIHGTGALCAFPPAGGTGVHGSACDCGCLGRFRFDFYLHGGGPTLYAPREVILWNWRRILLLGISIAFALGSQFSLVLLFPLAAGFLLYLAPERRGAALVILTAGFAIALVILAALYSFQSGDYARLYSSQRPA